MDAIIAEGLTKWYGKKPVVRQVNLRIPEGTVYALLGRNGAGKSTLVKMLTGMVKPDLGSSQLLGEDSRNLSAQIKTRIAYMAENHPLFDSWTVGGIVNWVRGFHPKWDGPMVERILDHFELSRKARIGRLSRGQRAQVALTLALGPDPDLFILDDPTLGLDPGVRRDFIESMVQMISRRGRTILFSTHILADVERTADRIGVLVDGELRVNCPIDHFRDQVRKIIVEFDRDPPEVGEVSGLVGDWKVGNRRELVFAGYGEPQKRAVEALEPRRVSTVELSLEDAFIEYTRGKRKPLPLWQGGDEE